MNGTGAPPTPLRVLVVGAGIVGLALAWRLRLGGAAVTVVDRAPPGEGGASSGNAGAISSSSVVPLTMPGLLRQVPRMLLDPAAPLHVPAGYWLRAAPWLSRFVAAARPAAVARAAAALDGLLRLATEQHLALAREVGAPELILPRGHLYLYRRAAQLAKDAAGWELRRSYGARVETLDRARIEALEPAVGPAYTVGVFLTDHAHCAEPRRYCHAIAEAFTRAGGEILRDEIVEITTAEGRVTGARGRERAYGADHVAVAAGAWSARLLAPLGYRVPLETQRGYHVNLTGAGVEVSRPVVPADRKVFITPMECGLRVAGTVEFGGLDRRPDPDRAALLHRDFQAVFPDADIERATDYWMGHRPCLPDSVPVIGVRPAASPACGSPSATAISASPARPQPPSSSPPRSSAVRPTPTSVLTPRSASDETTAERSRGVSAQAPARLLDPQAAPTDELAPHGAVGLHAPAGVGGRAGQRLQGVLL